MSDALGQSIPFGGVVNQPLDIGGIDVRTALRTVGSQFAAGDRRSNAFPIGIEQFGGLVEVQRAASGSEHQRPTRDAHTQSDRTGTDPNHVLSIERLSAFCNAFACPLWVGNRVAALVNRFSTRELGCNE